ncbi:MAG TPA: hypothetical protein VIF57_17360 [Polyangia bacterium]
MSLLDERSRGGAPPPRTDDEVDYLLSAGRLGSAQRDRIFAAVAAATSSRPRRRFAARRGAALAGAAALAALFGVSTSRRAPLDRDAFRDKGAAPAAASVGVACLRATLAACPRGSVLAFSVRGATADTLVTAVMRPAGGGDTTSLLTDEPTSQRAPSDTELLARGARIPVEQPPGRYTIEVLLTRRSPKDVVARARIETTVSP